MFEDSTNRGGGGDLDAPQESQNRLTNVSTSRMTATLRQRGADKSAPYVHAPTAEVILHN